MESGIKVGDRVRIISYGYWDGHLGTVISESDRGQVFTVRLDWPPGALFGAALCDLEPIADPAHGVTP